LRVRVRTPPLPVLLRATAEVAGMRRHPRRLRCGLAPLLALRRAARDLSIAEPHVRLEPRPAEPARTLEPVRPHRRRLLAARRRLQKETSEETET
jgi:hypothetical protein